MRVRTVLGSAAAAVMLFSTPAFAANPVTDSGTKSCGVGTTVEIVATFSGNAQIYWAGAFRDAAFHNGMYTDRWFTGRRSTSWEVLVTSGALDDDDTFATCVPSA